MFRSLVLALAVAFAYANAQGGYGEKPIAKDTFPEDQYGGSKKSAPVHFDAPVQLPVKGSSYGSGKGSPIQNMDTLPIGSGDNAYGGSRSGPFGDFQETRPRTIEHSGVCKTTDRWMGIVECYDCELNSCAKQCLPELPKNFGMCYNKTALFNLKTLFIDCLGEDVSKCHRLTEDMALAFLLAHYDQRVLDVNRRNECIFRCGRPRVMNCMNMCDPLDPTSDIQKEPIVLCYKSLETKIHDMLVEFASCLDQYQSLA